MHDKLIKSYSIGDLSHDDSEQIKINKKKFIQVTGDELELLKFPGFTVSNFSDIKEYAVFYKQQFETKITPPRGNLSSTCKLIIVGIKPGKMFKDKPHEESSWLFGPCSVLLHNMLREIKQYPYFTNVYKQWDDPEDIRHIEILSTELNIVLRTIKKEKINIVTLGNYPEYELLKGQLSNNFNIVKAWHPSYLCRAYSENKFKEWVKYINSTIINV